MPEYKYLREDILSYSYYTEEGNYFPHPDPLFSWMLLGRALLEMPDDIWVINTSVNVENSRKIPNEFKLEQNHPNPFNASTVIEFYLPAAQAIYLAVYSVTGQKIRDLANGTMNAGNHSIRWDGCGEHGSPVSSGVYFYRIVSGDFSGGGRMTLMK